MIIRVIRDFFPAPVISPTRLLSLGILTLVLLTWKLWTPQSVFPQIPLIRAACYWPRWLDWVSLTILVASAVLMGLFVNSKQIRQTAATAIAASLLVLFTLDQHRLQPWAWQFFLLAILLSLADDATTRRCWMGLVISVYFWSALSKLDTTFCHEQGPALLAGFRKAIGLRGLPNRWTESFDVCASLGIVCGELTTAVLLIWPRTRRFGYWASILMHASLLTALGPLGLKHSYGVLGWNIFFIIQNGMLFRDGEHCTATGEPGAVTDWSWTRLTDRTRLCNSIATSVVVAAALWPALEPFGLCDHWLAWAVYSSRPAIVEITVIDVLQQGLSPVPTESLATGLRPNIGQLSFNELGVPVYPEARFQLGVLWSLTEHFDLRGVAVVWETPDRITGRRTRQAIPFGASNTKDLESACDSFRWNARPRQRF